MGDGLTVGVPLLLDFGPEKAIVDATGWPNDDKVLHISGESPAGIAIAAAHEGETVSYRIPNGTNITAEPVASSFTSALLNAFNAGSAPGRTTTSPVTAGGSALWTPHLVTLEQGSSTGPVT